MRRAVGVVACLLASALPSLATDPATADLVSLNGTELFVRRVGTSPPGESPVIVVHGGPMLDHGVFLPHLLPLGSTRELVFFDQRVNGRSAPVVPDSTMRLDTLVADVEALRAHVGAPRVDVIGHSWGGLIALRYALAHPERVSSLVLVSSMPASAEEWQAEELVLAERVSEDDQRERADIRASEAFQRGEPEALASLLRASFRPQFADPARADELELYVPDDYMDRSARFGGVMVDLMAYDLRDELAELRVPTLVLVGAVEPAAQVSGPSIHDALPASTFAVVPDAGHFAFVENPDVFLAIVRGFWKGREVSRPGPVLRSRLSLDAHYTRSVVEAGLPIVASDRVAPEALLEARAIVREMTAHRGDLLPALAEAGVRVAVMSEDEMTTDIPEHADLVPADYWDKRARGLGATSVRPAVSCGEENLLGFLGDPYADESILVHEFAHVVHELAMSRLDPAFADRLVEAFRLATDAGRWEGTYAATNVSEYWAEATQSWFDTNRSADAQHNHVDTRSELKEYDPPVSALLAEVYGDRAWRYRPARERAGHDHLASWSFDDAPTFAWPPEVVEAFTAFEFAASGEPLPPSHRWTDVDPTTAETSPTSHEPAALLVVNAGETPLSVEWLNADGERAPVGRVTSGTHRVQPTYRGHVWSIVGEDGREVRVVASAVRGRVVVD